MIPLVEGEGIYIIETNIITNNRIFWLSLLCSLSSLTSVRISRAYCSFIKEMSQKNSLHLHVINSESPRDLMTD